MRRTEGATWFHLRLLTLSFAAVSVSAFDPVLDPSRRLSFGQLLGVSLSLQQQQQRTTTIQTSASAASSFQDIMARDFPRALTYQQLLPLIARRLLPPDDTTTTTTKSSNILLATSLCCDEVNRELERELEAYYGDHFNLGGLAGFPFSGITGFQAMQGHIPDNGSALIVFGPHIGIDSMGVLGTIDRRGKHDETACCGSAVAALNYARQQLIRGSRRARTFETLDSPQYSLDLEQAQVNALVLSQIDRLERAENPLLELSFALFDIQDTVLRQIIAQAKLKAALNLLGGIQINTPAGVSDYFLPLTWEMMSVDSAATFHKNHLDELYEQ